MNVRDQIWLWVDCFGDSNSQFGNTFSLVCEYLVLTFKVIK